MTYAQLTDAGGAKLEEASCAHVGSIRTLFEEHFSQEEIEALASALAKLPGAEHEADDCVPG